jgi:hypothetical protein
MPLAAGVYTRVRRWLTDSNASIAIEPALHDTEDDSIAAALNLALYRDGQAAATANIPMGGFKFTGIANGSSDTDSIALGQANSLYLFKSQLGAGIPVNASITSSVASNALTIALKTAAGTDASSASPVLLPFRSATSASGVITVASVTAAISLVISSGSTMGTANSSPFRIWAVAFLDGSTVKLAAINSQPNTFVTSHRRLAPWQVASATAEGGAGGADTRNVFYAASAVTTMPYVILGYFDWSSGLATAGTWNTASDAFETFSAQTPLPGTPVQILRETDGSAATGTTTIPYDDTIPTSTEGDQYMTVTITPTSAVNRLLITHSGIYASSSTAANAIAALFQDAGASALAVVVGGRNAAAGSVAAVNLEHRMIAAIATATTFKLRAGYGSAGTTTFNGAAGARSFGGVFASHLTVEEIMA